MGTFRAVIDVKLTICAIGNYKLDELTVEHLTNSHPVLLLILTDLFKVIMSAAHVPYGFRLSYTVPLPKDDTIRTSEILSIVIGQFQ